MMRFWTAVLILSVLFGMYTYAQFKPVVQRIHAQQDYQAY